jgi:transcriptional regulator with PAS, ATPase and Fis domain
LKYLHGNSSISRREEKMDNAAITNGANNMVIADTKPLAAANKSENFTDRTNGASRLDFGELIGSSESMLQIFRTIEKVAKSDSTVIVYGESGTGKELVARAIHSNSDRRNNKIVAVNCGAIPEELLESELFGHEKGAFTGAIRSRTGRFELAQGGTIFLDEIGDMSPSLQVKLLRVIQEKTFERVGGIKTIKADVRIISATNQDLEKAVEEKRFRDDLFYRVNVIPIYIPPLRKRKSEIPVLVDHFLKKFNNCNSSAITGFSSEAIQLFINYSWPGNVRELQNLIERIVVIKESGEVTVDDLPAKMRLSVKTGEKSTAEPDPIFPDQGIDLNKTVEDFEINLLCQALEKASGIKSNAARLLGINRTTLVEKIKRFKIAKYEK